MEKLNPTIKEQELDDGIKPSKNAREVIGMFQTSSSIPSGKPFNWFNQIVIYSNGSTYRLYWYDTTNNVWRYASGT